MADVMTSEQIRTAAKNIYYAAPSMTNVNPGRRMTLTMDLRGNNRWESEPPEVRWPYLIAAADALNTVLQFSTEALERALIGEGCFFA